MKRLLTIAPLTLVMLSLLTFHLDSTSNEIGRSFIVRAQKREASESKDPADFPPAGPTCLNPGKVELIFLHGSPVGPNNSKYKCVAIFSVCGNNIQQESPVYDTSDSEHSCDSFDEQAKKKIGMSVCCQERPCPAPKVRYTGEISCDCNADGQFEITKVFTSCGIKIGFPLSFRTTCEKWAEGNVPPTDHDLRDSIDAYLETIGKTCPTLNCHRDYGQCMSASNSEYQKCLEARVTGIGKTGAYSTNPTADCSKASNNRDAACKQKYDKCIGNIKAD